MLDLSAFDVTGTNNPAKQVSVTRWNGLLDAIEANSISFRPEDYGAEGDGTTNDTTAFSDLCTAVNAAGGGLIVLKPGATYLIGGFANQPYQASPLYTYYNWPPTVLYILNLTSGRVVIEGNGATIKNAAGGSFGTFNTSDQTAKTARSPDTVPYTGTGAATPYYALLYANGLTSLSVRNLVLDGNIQNTTKGAQFGDTGIQLPMHGINLESCSQVLIQNVVSKNNGLDGLHLFGSEDSESDVPTLTIIENCDFRNNGRNNWSCTGGRSIILRNSILYQAAKNAGGVASNPAAGIDFEAEGGHIVRDVLVENCYIADNAGQAIVADSGTPIERVRVRNSALIGTTNYSIWTYRPGFKFEDCLILGTVAGAQNHKGFGVGADKVQPHNAVKYRRCTFTDDASLSPTGTVYQLNDLLFEGGVAYVEFDECAFIRTRNVTAGGGNANGMRYRDCTFIARSGALTMYGRYDGAETHFIEDGGTVGLPNRFNVVSGRTDTGDALDSWYYTTVASDVPTTIRHNATLDRQTRDVLGTRTTAIDADFTLTQGTDRRVQKLSGTLTANRAITLSGGRMGSKFRIVRTGGGAFSWDVGGLKSLTANQWCEVEHDGSAYVLTAYGTL